jgi:hypothetical protein
MKKILLLLLFSAYQQVSAGQSTYTARLNAIVKQSSVHYNTNIMAAYKRSASFQDSFPGRYDSDSIFQNVPAFYRMGKTYQVIWNEAISAHLATLMLYQDDTYLSTLQEDITLNYYKGKVPAKDGTGKRLQPGGVYNFILYDQVTRQMKASKSFQLKRRIPLAVQIPVYVGIAGGVGILLNSLLKKEDNQPEEPLLPDPPSPRN